MSGEVPGLWAALPEPVLVLDGASMVVRVNPAGEDFLNASARSVLGRPVRALLVTDAPLQDALARARANAAPISINDIDVAAPGRAALRANLRIAPLPEMADHMLLTIHTSDPAGHMARSQSVASAAKSAIGMAEMLAHEIKNPLAGITGAAQLLSMGLRPQDRELTDLIVSESRRIVALLEQVEQFGNTSPPDRRAVNVHDVLDRARRSAQLGVAAGMRIVEDYDPSLPPAWADPDQLLRVVQNLVQNAAEAAGDKGGTIRLRSSYDPSLRLRGQEGPGRPLPLQIEVIDDGPGLPPAIAADVFDPFVSGRENGTGLGLALAAKIVTDHGGWIAVQSVPGQTVFRISLPRADGKEA